MRGGDGSRSPSPLTAGGDHARGPNSAHINPLPLGNHLLLRQSANLLPVGPGGVPVAMICFVWIGTFSLMIVAQFWSFANDIYSKVEGELAPLPPAFITLRSLSSV